MSWPPAPPIPPELLELPYPFQSLMGFEITGWGEGCSRVELAPLDAVENRHGIPHGGAISVLLDTAMGYAGSYTGDAGEKRMAMTLSMTVNFQGQAQGTRLISEGRKTGGGRKTFFAEARLCDEHGNLVATATGVFRYRTPQA
ncbi:PaaI family thioesterase [Vannielia litorea]|uniref:PaaI family thioesterase n=1 Tax=Vannielia litorea TaxID=1217970 RepID=UPI001C95D2E3|nr:PaaI family thioesterase [Vannielia litorea]MBY6047818.1 PaaI family thioesterase [Vannielia litorea]MBY6075232.1 PaaI family thioesterase [Vannielia litorea]